MLGAAVLATSSGNSTTGAAIAIYSAMASVVLGGGNGSLDLSQSSVVLGVLTSAQASRARMMSDS